MSEKSLRVNKWARRAGAATAVVALAAGGVHMHNENEAKRKIHTPAIAGPILADRVGACALTIDDTHKAPAEGSFLGPGHDVINYTIDQKFKPNAQAYYAAFVATADVLWSHDVITRSYMSQYPKMKPYAALPTMGSANWNSSHPTKDGRRVDKLDPGANGTQIEGSLVPQAHYEAGSFIDIWSNESTTYRSEAGDATTSLRAVYCGRMVMHDVAGVPTWQLDKNTRHPALEAHAQVVPYRLDTLEQEKALLPLQPLAKNV